MLLSVLRIVAAIHCKTGDLFTRGHIAACLRDRLQLEQSLAHCGQAVLSPFKKSTKIVDSPCGKSLRGLNLSTVLSAVASTVSSGISLVRNRAKHVSKACRVTIAKQCHPVKLCIDHDLQDCLQLLPEQKAHMVRLREDCLAKQRENQAQWHRLCNAIADVRLTETLFLLLTHKCIVKASATTLSSS